MSTTELRYRWEPRILLALIAIGFVVSGAKPQSRITWFLEVAPILVGLPILIATHRRFPLTPLAYELAFVLSALLLIGGHYTYSRVPIGLEARRLLGLRRNDYDRVVHFVGGFVPAILGREFVRRRAHLARKSWVFFFVVSGCLAGAATYELLEWAAAEAMGSGAKSFLAMQGDPWDTQWDMFTCFIGAIVSLLFLSRFHERQLEKLRSHGLS